MLAIFRSIAVVYTLVWSSTVCAVPIAFNFEFFKFNSSWPDSEIAAGTGSVSFDDVGIGSFPLSSLTDLSMTFNIVGQAFTLADVTNPLTEVVAVVSDFGTVRRFQFSNVNPIGSGSSFGSIDFDNANGANLNFEPPFFNQGLVFFNVNVGGDRTGLDNYLATQVPLPSSLALFGLGLILLRRVHRARARVIDIPRNLRLD